MATTSGIKNQFILAIKGLRAFEGKEANVHPFREMEPESARDQDVSRLTGLAAFVSTERIQKGSHAPVKQVTMVVDLWVNVWTEIAQNEIAEGDGDIITDSAGNPLVTRIQEAEDLVADAVIALEGIVTEPSLPAGNATTFQDAFRMITAPKPYLVYRILTTAHLILDKE